ncbi:FG-GAP repeat protein [Lamprobacter modestohalophilus]|uniref:FG-GAP repeat protein n=1 Tax=Lamprobacter modestohalophilus TaxID=1064514 RepID=UPI002ADEF917|nr:FG-GAP repeat protein [Lamprobacter modestohalophilus]MEA1050991.1 FG-GAP repeat protein [Lamprobacter modestohalophilus]
MSIGLTALVGLLPLSGAWAGYVEEKLTASDGAAYDYFGKAVAIDGNKVLIGASGGNAAYLIDADTGNDLQKFTVSGGGTYSEFGYSVAMDGDKVLIGDRFGAGNGSVHGAAYLFDTSGNQLLTFTASDGENWERFGESVAISGDYVVIGAHLEDENGSQAGAAYLFNANTGAQIAKLTSSDIARFDHFGASVAIDGDYILIGATRDDDQGSSSGAAYLFDTSGTQLQKFTASDGSNGAAFGSSVAIDGNTLLIGASEQFGNGSAYLFSFDATSHTELHKFTASDGAYQDRFGGSVALDGDKALIGAAQHDFLGNSARGSAYLFDTATGNELQKITASDHGALDNFGGSVALSGDRLVMGAQGDDDISNNSGAAYLYTTQTTPPPTNVPTPSTLALMLVAGLGLVVSGRRFSGSARGLKA